jgi:hypothetical protein
MIRSTQFGLVLFLFFCSFNRLEAAIDEPCCLSELMEASDLILIGTTESVKDISPLEEKELSLIYEYCIVLNTEKILKGNVDSEKITILLRTPFSPCDATAIENNKKYLLFLYKENTSFYAVSWFYWSVWSIENDFLQNSGQEIFSTIPILLTRMESAILSNNPDYFIKIGSQTLERIEGIKEALCDMDTRIQNFAEKEIRTIYEKYYYYPESFEVPDIFIQALKIQYFYLNRNHPYVSKEIESKANELLFELIENLNHKNEIVVFQMISALESMGKNASQSIPELTKLLKNKKFKLAVSLALFKIGFQGEELFSSFEEIFNTANSDLHEEALLALEKTLTKTDEALPLLKIPLKSENKGIQYKSAILLAKWGIKTREVGLILIEALESKEVDRDIRAEVLGVFEGVNIEIQKSIPPLIKVFEDSFLFSCEDVRKMTIEMLGKMISKHPEAIVILVQLFKDENFRKRTMIVGALECGVVAETTEVIGILEEALRDKEYSVSTMALRALNKIKCKNK